MLSTKRTLLIISFLSALLQVVVSEQNLSILDQGELILTADSPSYMNPPKNFAEEGVWKDNFKGPSSYVQRPPFYGIIYLITYLTVEDPLLVLKWIQYGVMGIGIYCFGLLVYHLTHSSRTAYSSLIIFGSLPLFHGFVGYVMTESIAPYLLIILTYAFLTSYKENKNVWLFIVMCVIIPLFRTQLILFPLVLSLLYISNKGLRKSWILLSLLPFILWQINVYVKMDSFQLHPIYASANETIYQPPHEALSELFRVWEHEGENLHSVVGILRSDPTKKGVDKALQFVPNKFRGGVKPALMSFQLSLHSDDDSIQESVRDEIRETTKNIGKSNRIQNWVITPINSAKALLGSSHLNLFIFQQHYRGITLTEALRVVCFSIVLLSFFMTVYLVVFSKEPWLKMLLLTFLFSFMYLVFIQRMNETRYLTPYLPFMFLALVYSVDSLRKRQQKPSA